MRPAVILSSEKVEHLSQGSRVCGSHFLRKICILRSMSRFRSSLLASLCFVDMLSKKEYTYSYEEGRLHRAAECVIDLNNDGMITSKTLVNTVLYVYNEEGTLIRKRILPADGEERVIYYETTDENTV